MANLPETPQWEDGIYQIEVSDPVLGGPDGISNRQAKQLASRTSYLKQQVEKGGSDLAKHIAAADPHTQYATKASPTFTGTPTAPTPAANDNSKKLVTTEFVARAIAALAGTVPETLDTLKELADALGNDPNFATTVLNKLAEKLAKDQNGADIPDKAAFLQNLGLLGGINSSAVGRLLNAQKISSSQAYTKTPGTKFGIVEVVGGGGAGGSPAQNGSEYTSGSGGGNSGCYVRFLVDLSSVDSVSCIIGAGGTPVAQQAGGMGGNTAFGSYATVLGGNGGLLLASATTTNRIYGMSPPQGNFGSINNAVLLDYNYGGLGGDAVIMSSGARAGFGAASKLGGQTFGPGNDTPGINATTYGGGGSGVVATSATQGANLLGGNGAGGVIIVWEYA